MVNSVCNVNANIQGSVFQASSVKAIVWVNFLRQKIVTLMLENKIWSFSCKKSKTIFFDMFLLIPPDN